MATHIIEWQRYGYASVRCSEDTSGKREVVLPVNANPYRCQHCDTLIRVVADVHIQQVEG